MSELEKRKKAAEAKFAVGEELVFKAIIKAKSHGQVTNGSPIKSSNWLLISSLTTLHE